MHVLVCVQVYCVCVFVYMWRPKSNLTVISQHSLVRQGWLVAGLSPSPQCIGGLYVYTAMPGFCLFVCVFFFFFFNMGS